jgi:hypothetical protein
MSRAEMNQISVRVKRLTSFEDPKAQPQQFMHGSHDTLSTRLAALFEPVTHISDHGVESHSRDCWQVEPGSYSGVSSTTQPAVGAVA